MRGSIALSGRRRGKQATWLIASLQLPKLVALRKASAINNCLWGPLLMGTRPRRARSCLSLRDRFPRFFAMLLRTIRLGLCSLQSELCVEREAIDARGLLRWHKLGARAGSSS